MKERKNRTREECVAIVAAIQEKIKNGMNAKKAIAAAGIHSGQYYVWRRRYTDYHPPTKPNSEIKVYPAPPKEIKEPKKKNGKVVAFVIDADGITDFLKGLRDE